MQAASPGSYRLCPWELHVASPWCYTWRPMGVTVAFQACVCALYSTLPIHGRDLREAHTRTSTPAASPFPGDDGARVSHQKQAPLSPEAGALVAGHSHHSLVVICVALERAVVSERGAPGAGGRSLHDLDHLLHFLQNLRATDGNQIETTQREEANRHLSSNQGGAKYNTHPVNTPAQPIHGHLIAPPPQERGGASPSQQSGEQQTMCLAIPDYYSQPNQSPSLRGRLRRPLHALRA